MKRSEHSAVQSKCPLWVKSGHVQCNSDVRFVPIANSCTAAFVVVIRSPRRRGRGAQEIAQDQ